MINSYRGVVHLPSDEAFEKLMRDGSLETDAGTIVYSPLDTTYTTPDTTEQQINDLSERMDGVEQSIGDINTVLESVLGV